MSLFYISFIRAGLVTVAWSEVASLAPKFVQGVWHLSEQRKPPGPAVKYMQVCRK